MFLFNWVEFFHPGRLTWNLEIIHLERKMMFQTFIIMFHVNLPGCRFHVLFALATWKRGQPKVYISAWHSRGKKRVYPIRKKKTAKMIRFLGYHEASSRISLSFGCFFSLVIFDPGFYGSHKIHPAFFSRTIFRLVKLQMFLLFFTHKYLGKMIQFDPAYFFKMGLKLNYQLDLVGILFASLVPSASKSRKSKGGENLALDMPV